MLYTFAYKHLHGFICIHTFYVFACEFACIHSHATHSHVCACYTFAFIHLHAYICIHLYAYIYMLAFCIHTFACIHLHTFVCIHLYASFLHTYICLHAYIHMHTLYICMLYIHMHSFICTHSHTYIGMHTFACSHSHVYIHMLHIHLETQSLALKPKSLIFALKLSPVAFSGEPLGHGPPLAKQISFGHRKK